VPNPKHELGAFVLLMVGVLQLSVAVGGVQLTIVQESMLTKVILLGQRVKMGLMVSSTQVVLTWWTITVNVQYVRLLFASVAAYPTIVLPIGKQVPELWVLTTVGVPQLSVAVGVAHCAKAQESSVVKTILLGQEVKVGLLVSPWHKLLTVMVNSQPDVLFWASLAKYETMVLPKGKHVPDCIIENIAATLQLSVAVGATQVATAQLSEVLKTILVGQAEINGLMVSMPHGLLTSMVNEQIPILPLKSVAR
jgi:hypothetical protein